METDGAGVGALTLSLASLLGQEKSGGEEAPHVQKKETPKIAESSGSVDDTLGTLQHVVLQRQRAGRGGKTVTVVSFKGLVSAPHTEAIARALRKGLGCGSTVEGDTIVLQGDIGDRAREWFVKKGVRKVILGN